MLGGESAEALGACERVEIAGRDGTVCPESSWELLMQLAGWAVLGKRDTAHIWKVCWKGEFVIKAVVTARAGRGVKSGALRTLHSTVGPFDLFVTAVQKNFTEG